MQKLIQFLTRARTLILTGSYQGSLAVIENALTEAGSVAIELAEAKAKILELQGVIDETNGQVGVLYASPPNWNFKTHAQADATVQRRNTYENSIVNPSKVFNNQSSAVAVPELIINALRQAVYVVDSRAGDVDTEDGSYATTGTDEIIRLESALCEALGTKYDDIDLAEALELLERLSTESVNNGLLSASYARDALHWKSKFDELMASPRITEQDDETKHEYIFSIGDDFTKHIYTLPIGTRIYALKPLCLFHDDDRESCEIYSGKIPCEPQNQQRRFNETAGKIHVADDKDVNEEFKQ